MKYLCLALILICAPINVWAQQTVVFQIMPPGIDGVVENVGRARYYLLEDYLLLAQFDLELVKLRADIVDLNNAIVSLERIVIEKDKIISALKSDKEILTTRSLRLENAWDTCEQKLIACSTPPVWPYIIASVGALVGVLGIGIWVGTFSR